MSNSPVLILGGAGVFGGRLARALAARGGIDVIVAGRDLSRTGRFARSIGARGIGLDRAAPDLAARIAAERPFAVIDAAGPFQDYSSDTVAAAAIACGAHYLDLSDDAGFTAGIGRLDATARAAAVTVLSGVSSVPALSSAAVEALGEGLTLCRIESVILPGNRAPRGLSVMRAILAQAGRPIAVRCDGQPAQVRGWWGLRRERLSVPGHPPLGPRWSSPIGAPDLALFPDRYRVPTVLFRAGLELPILHLGLALLAVPVRLGLLRSIEPLARPLRWIADRTERWGSDRGGMVVRVLGRDAEGHGVAREWALIAGAGDGPDIPTIPARVMVERLLAGRAVPGARPCLGEFALAEAEAMTAGLTVVTGRRETPHPPIFATALGADFAALPEPVRDLHDVLDARSWTGTARIDRGRHPLARLICRAVGFPAAGVDVPVRMTMRREGGREVWTRSFGDRTFRSVLDSDGPAGSGRIGERFGPLRFGIALSLREGALHYPVRSGRFLGVPLPRILLPSSVARETVEDGRPCFDVAIAVPVAGLLVRYRGTLSDTAKGPAPAPLANARSGQRA